MKKSGLTIKINLSNRWLYSLIILGILLIVGVGVYAYGTSVPATFGHSVGEMDFTGGFTVPSGDVTVDGKVSADEVCIGEDCKSDWNLYSCEWKRYTSGNAGTACNGISKSCLFSTVLGDRNMPYPNSTSFVAYSFSMSPCGRDASLSSNTYYAFCCG